VANAEETITGSLEYLLGHSSPGDTLHHLDISAAPRGPLGLDLNNLHNTVCAIDGLDEMVAKTIMAMTVEAHEAGRGIYFAGLAMENYEAPRDAEAHRLRGGKLGEHPQAVEVTRLYAACADGRRWVGWHYLAGPQAGTKVGPLLRTGMLAKDELGTHQGLIRAAVRAGAAR
jgi:hypothetical protein